MKSQNRSYYFVEAKPEDGQAILEILEEPDFEGDLSIIYTRRPNPVLSLKAEGDEVLVMLCKSKKNDELIGFGCCTIRQHYVKGQLCSVGYLSGLRVKKEYRMMPFLLVDAYQELIEWIKSRDIQWVYTTVLDDNPRVQKMFEKKRKRFPSYIPIGGYTVHCSTVQLGKPSNRDYDIRPALEGDIQEILSFLEKQGRTRNLLPRLTREDLMGSTSLNMHYSNYRIAVRTNGGDIIALTYVWHQEEHKQHILHKYNGIYSALKCFSPLLPYIGYPRLPKEGSLLNYYTLSFYGYQVGEHRAMECLIRHIARERRNCDYFLMGMMSDDPLNDILSKFAKITYTSKVYFVDYTKSQESEERLSSLDDVYVECGLL